MMNGVSWSPDYTEMRITEAGVHRATCRRSTTGPTRPRRLRCAAAASRCSASGRRCSRRPIVTASLTRNGGAAMREASEMGWNALVGGLIGAGIPAVLSCLGLQGARQSADAEGFGLAVVLLDRLNCERVTINSKPRCSQGQSGRDSSGSLRGRAAAWRPKRARPGYLTSWMKNYDSFTWDEESL